MIHNSRQHCILVTIALLILSFSTQAQTATHKTPFDFDGDSKTDLAVWRPADGTWYIFQSLTQTSRFESFGLSTDKIVPGDYDGDGKTDVAVFRLSNNTWYVLKSTNGAVISQQWGLNGDLPVAGDYDGDGKTDFAIFRPQDNTWQILKSSNGGYMTLSFGGIGDVPVRGDFDGDGKADFAVWRPGTGYWYYINSSDPNQALQQQQWGLGSLGDTVGAGDYDGDGKTDLAVWRSSNGYWYVLKSSGGTISQQFGSGPNGDVPVPGNYDGDSKTDFAVWRVPTGTWYTLKSSNNTTTAQAWGSQAAGDKLAPSAFIPTGAVAGTIATRTGAAISGALIEVFDQGVFKTAVASGSTGYFSAGGVLTGKYELRVSANGYKDVRLTGINVVAGGTTTSNVTLAEQTVLLEDSFSDNCILGLPASTCAPDTIWQAGLIGEAGNSTISVAETDQRLQLAIPCSGSPNCQTQSNIFNGVRSINTYDLGDAYVSVRVVEPAGQSDGLETRLDVGIDSGNKLQFMISGGGTLYARKIIDNETTELGNTPFSAATMAYIRIRFKPNVSDPAQSRIYFETSPTGADGTWTVLNNPANQLFNDFFLSSVKVSLNTGTYNSVTGVHKAVFDDFKFAKHSTALAKAGEDQALTLGGTVSLDGSYSTSEGGTISSYKWTFTSKPSGAPDPAISSSTSATTGITGLTFVGYYNFQLTVIDSLNSVSTDTVRVFVAEAPVARISAPTTIIEDEPIVFDGSFSSGAYEVAWDFGDGRKAEISRATHLYMTPGTYTVTLKVTNEAGATAPSFPAAIATFQVTVGLLDEATNSIDFPTNLQAAIDSANGFCGRTDITLQHGVDYGSITLPTRVDGCNGYIRILSDNLNSLPPKGTRISENDIANMPRVTTQTSDAAMKTNAAAHHYRFIGILFRRGPNNNAPVLYTLVSLGVPEETQQVASNTPHHFVFDRCIFSNIAFPENTTSDKRIQHGLQLHSGSTSVINSHFREFKCDCDAQAIVSWSGLGPHAIINNYLESATEIVMYGGASMRIPYATPSDITIRGNYFFKPVRWATEKIPNLTPGQPDVNISVKNHFELKHARNVIFDGNVLQNTFPRGQSAAIVLTVRNQYGDNPWSSVQNVQITNNKIDYAGEGFGVLPIDDVYSSLPVRNFIISNNLWDRILRLYADPADPTSPRSDAHFGQVAGMMNKLWITHNTVFQEGAMLKGYGPPLIANDSDFRYNNNILRHNVGGFITDGVNDDGLRFLNTYATGWMMRRNVVAFPDDKAGFIPTYPFRDNPAMPSSGSLDLNRYLGPSEGTFEGRFLDHARRDFRIADVPYGGFQWATDGSDVGVTFSPLLVATAGVRAGFWTTNSGVVLLADNFNDLARDTLAWAPGTVFGNSSSVIVNEQNNRLEITSPSGSGEHWSGYDAIYPLNFDGAQASVEVPQVVGNEGGETWLFVYQDNANFFRFGARRESNGNFTLIADKVSGGSYQNFVSATYSAANHRWWRIRHQTSSNTVLFETSANGITWSTQGSTSNHVSTSALRVSIGAGKTSGTSTSASTAAFDNLKVSK